MSTAQLNQPSSAFTHQEEGTVAKPQTNADAVTSVPPLRNFFLSGMVGAIVVVLGTISHESASSASPMSCGLIWVAITAFVCMYQCNDEQTKVTFLTSLKITASLCAGVMCPFIVWHVAKIIFG